MTGMYQTTTDTHNMRSHREDDFRLPEGVRCLTHRLQDAGYLTANLKTIGDKVVGTGKLDLNFVNEGPIYQTDDWEKLKGDQPFFAQINMPEAEYDIYDRKSAEKPRVKWVGEEWHPPTRNTGERDAATLLPGSPDHTPGMGPLPELGFRNRCTHRLDSRPLARGRFGGRYGRDFLRR